MPWVLGLDGGGSRTVALIANERGRVLGRGESGPGNFHTAGLVPATENIRHAARGAIGDAGLVPSAIDTAYFALAGIDRPVDRQVMSAAVASLGLRCPIILENDACAAWAGALSGKPGVVVLAGTGSIAFGQDPKGNTARAGGYGPLLGDEGSGYDIGRRAMIAALRAEDRRGPSTSLTERIRRRFMLDKITDLTHLLYGDPPPLQRPDVAGIAPLVEEAALEGDAIAREILRVAGRELGLLAAAVLQQLNWEKGKTVYVAGGGGAFAAGNFLSLPMQQVIRSAWSTAELTHPQHTPTYGAVLLALRSLGLELEEMPGERNR